LVGTVVLGAETELTGSDGLSAASVTMGSADELDTLTTAHTAANTPAPAKIRRDLLMTKAPFLPMTAEMRGPSKLRTDESWRQACPQIRASMATSAHASCAIHAR